MTSSPGQKVKQDRPPLGRDVVGLIVFVGLCLAVSLAGGVATASSVSSWYPTLQKPPFNPPDWIFAPVWSVLYLCIAVAGWRVWRTAPLFAVGRALTTYGAQLGLNLAWSVLFFGLQRPDLALINIVVLFVVIVANAILFWRHDRWAGALLVPYAMWVAFAAVLNASIWMLN